MSGPVLKGNYVIETCDRPQPSREFAARGCRGDFSTEVWMHTNESAIPLRKNITSHGPGLYVSFPQGVIKFSLKTSYASIPFEQSTFCLPPDTSSFDNVTLSVIENNNRPRPFSRIIIASAVGKGRLPSKSFLEEDESDCFDGCLTEIANYASKCLSTTATMVSQVFSAARSCCSGSSSNNDVKMLPY